MGTYGKLGRAAVCAALLALTVAAGQARAAQVDLTQGWGAARACFVLGGVAECFADGAAMQAREAEVAPALAASASCGAPLRLYANTGYGGRELDLYDRGYWQNLSDYGFDGATSSYRVGSCDTHLAEGGDGGGYWYPGDTSSGHAEPALTAGSSDWDNRISSVYLE
jgi:hypothetical protein